VRLARAGQVGQNRRRVTLLNPRASFMAHHIGDFQVAST
jgi:hypothetical protein